MNMSEYNVQEKNIEDITQWRRTISHESAQRISKILFLPLEHKIHFFELTRNFL